METPYAVVIFFLMNILNLKTPPLFIKIVATFPPLKTAFSKIDWTGSQSQVFLPLSEIVQKFPFSFSLNCLTWNELLMCTSKDNDQYGENPWTEFTFDFSTCLQDKINCYQASRPRQISFIDCPGKERPISAPASLVRIDLHLCNN